MQDMTGKVCVITGANTGIGKETARGLARAGARVVMACRSQARAGEAMEEIRADVPDAALDFLALDLGSLAAVAGAAEALLARGHAIDVLINNAGVAGQRGQTADGFEVQLGVNHLGHFLWTLRLLERLKASAPSRVVHVASRAHKRAAGIDFEGARGSTRSRTGFPEYCESKLANVLFSRELARRLAGSGVTSYALHPGVIASDIWRRVPAPVRWVMTRFMKSNEEGAQTTLMCAADPALGASTGEFFSEGARATPEGRGADDGLAARLWAFSLEAVRDHL